jgi:hypothetical protein
MTPDRVQDRGAAILQQMPTVRDVDGSGRATAPAIGVDRPPVARDHLDAGAIARPGSEAVRVPVGQEVDDGASLQIHEDGAVAVAAPPRPVVHAKDPGRRGGARGRLGPHETEQGITAHRHAEPPGQPRAGLAAKDRAEVALDVAQPRGAPGMRSGDMRQALREDPAGTGGVGAMQASYPQSE